MQIENPMMFVRSIKGAPASVLWVLVLVRRSLTLRDLIAYTDYHADKLRAAIDVLTGYELVKTDKLAHGESIFSIGAGYQYLISGIGPALIGNPEHDLIGFCAEDDEIQNTIKSDSGAEIPEKQGQNTIKSDSGGPKQGSIMMIDDESLIINDSSSIRTRETLPNLEILLEATELLFGETLDFCDLPAGTTSAQLLPWLVKGWHDRNRLKNPLGMIRVRVRSGTPRSLPKNWQERLPSDFLKAIGVITQSAPVEPDPADEPEPEIIAAEVDAPIGRAWEAVKTQLQGQIPRGNFASYVGDTLPLRWEADARRLTVLARDERARDWLENRLTSTAEHLLAGVLNCGVDLQFAARAA